MDQRGTLLIGERARRHGVTSTVVLLYEDGTRLKRPLVCCNTIQSRLVGMLGRRDPGVEEVYQIVPCNGIHTFGMAFDIDTIFTDREGNVLRARNVKPWRMFACPEASMVFEGRGLLRSDIALERLWPEYYNMS